MSDTINIHQLSVAAIIGVHEWEQQLSQVLKIDVALSVDTRAAGDADELPTTTSYGDVARYITKFVEASRFKLIETLANRLAAELLTNFSITAVDLEVHKPAAVKNAQSVSVRIQRTPSANQTN